MRLVVLRPDNTKSLSTTARNHPTRTEETHHDHVHPQNCVGPVGQFDFDRHFHRVGSPAAEVAVESAILAHGGYDLPKFGFSSFNINGFGERVTNVRWGGIAQRMGLESGDMILSLNGYPLTYHGSWNDALREAVYQRRLRAAERFATCGPASSPPAKRTSATSAARSSHATAATTTAPSRYKKQTMPAQPPISNLSGPEQIKKIVELFD